MKLFNGNITKGRPAILTYSTSLDTISLHTAVLAYTLLIIIMPAFCSCEESTPENTENVRTFNVHKSYAVGNSGSLDIFFFNDDNLRLLDSYQRLYSIPSDYIEASSRAGDKILFAIAGSSMDPGAIGRYDDLNGVSANLREENPESPVMTACTSVRAGNGSITARLEPLLSEITVNSICCDFHKKPYAGQKLEDVRIYLTNARDMYPVSGEGPGGGSFVNCGSLSEDDMKDPVLAGLLQASLEEDLGDNVVHPGIHLYCYPNKAEEESLGTPFTRLVIEGTLGGEKTYYPITISPDPEPSGGSRGVGRNKSYAFDITICRRGVPSPDIPIEVGTVRCGFRVKEWKVMDERTIGF